MYHIYDTAGYLIELKVDQSTELVSISMDEIAHASGSLLFRSNGYRATAYEYQGISH